MVKVSENKPRRKIVVEEVGDIASTVEIDLEPKNEVQEIVQPEPEIVAETPNLNPIEVEPIQPSVEDQSFQPQGNPGPSPLVVIVPGLFLLGALLGGIVFYQRSLEEGQNLFPTSTETPVETTQATSSPAPTVDVTKYEIKVLNGSGIAGEASKAQDLIEGEGFVVSSTGNAANYSYTQTIIQVKEGVDEGFIAKLKETLSEGYKVSVTVEDLEDSSKDSVIVIVGSTKS